MKDIIQNIFDRHSLGVVKEVSELKGGTFNRVFGVSTEKRKYAVKVVCDSKKEVLTYEKGLIETEVKVYELLQGTQSVYFPKIHGFNYADGYEHKYLIMDFVEGSMLNKTKLSKEEYGEVMYSLGKAMAEIHRVRGEGFGYMQCGLKSTMREAYLSMTDNLIADARRKVRDIPFADRVRRAIDENISAFDSVTVPVLNHFDLWGGNIVVKDGKLSALIDCERAMFGVPEGDFISLDYLAPFNIEKNRQLVEGYNSVASEKISFEGDSLKRFYLMRLLLGMIVFTESHYRYGKLSPMYIGSKIFGRQVIKNAVKGLENI
ncbi:MAG: aminoglycoside phosphotransferase family protein [Clostridia bacterium]|nr:aminoglycoside phosphotransferase family protein [Clostridia bacterium]